MAYLPLNTLPFNSYIFLYIDFFTFPSFHPFTFSPSHLFTFSLLHPFHLFTFSFFHFFTFSPFHFFTFSPFHLFLLYHNKLDVHDALWRNARIDCSASSKRFRHQRTITEHVIHTLRLVLGKGVAQA